ncbi:hypothetical protein [Mesonia sp. K7]|uniref:hypothetical protein n=1 Tax=Mesonia sp. K7 TaxID=2218606 RepID=UPI000DA8994C|nr:hypothetical protein [Mesonia sp. K7]PZD77732.1 hypothetical protein DNG35_07805 [Mesonia sp. K7]
MKKAIKNLSILFSATILSMTAISCSNDDDSTGDDDPGVETELTGSITENLTLDASTAYTLNGALSVESGAVLTIPAGTRINTGTGTGVLIAVQKGADIVIQGTSSNPVVMGPQGDGVWGGLVILGDATTTAGIDAEAEVNSFLYGGTNDSDSSGSIEYLIIKDSGAQINPESQYNGLSLYAVGSGTTINNVAFLGGQDDGVEFFGGTVSASNIYVENLEDDAVDWTEGWNGTLTNTYVLHDIEGFSTAIEADGTNANPTINNFTAVSTTGGIALQFKKQSGATITGLSLNGYETSLDFVDGGATSNVTIDGLESDPNMTYTGPATVNISDFQWVQDAANQEILSGQITNTLTLDPAISYRLSGILSVEEGAKLVIPAGTNIVTATGTDVYIAVQKGGDIEIQGEAGNPVVMGPDTAGTWGGIVILGDATTTAGINAEAEVGSLIYGGTNDSDSSGSIEYLIIKQSGAQINPESQYNGLSLYAVGSGTTIENIAFIGGADDGVEFFGGTVSATNIYVEDLEDDAVDWTEGWNGTISNIFVKHTNSNFSTAIEADGTNANPSINNFTAVSTAGGIGLQFKKQSGATITGLTLIGYATNVDMVDGGDLSNVQIDGADASTTTTYSSSTTVETDFSWVE